MSAKLPALRGRLAAVMLALRPGPMTPGQIEERFGSRASADLLVKHGLATREEDRFYGTSYRLTDEGRAKCPSRRELFATAEAFIAATERRKKGWESSGRKMLAREGAAA